MGTGGAFHADRSFEGWLEAIAGEDEDARTGALNAFAEEEKRPQIVARLEEVARAFEALLAHRIYAHRSLLRRAVESCRLDFGELTRHPDPGVRVGAVRLFAAGILGNGGVEDQHTRLVDFLEDPYPQVRRAAAIRLAWSFKLPEPLEKRAVPVLLAGIRDGEPEVRTAFAAALECRGPGTFHTARREISLPLALEMWKDPEPRVRSSAVRVLQTAHRKSREAIDLLVGALRHPDRIVRRQAAMGLGNRGFRAWRAIPALKEARRSASAFSDRWWIGDAICRIHNPILPWRTLIFLYLALLGRLLLFIPGRKVRQLVERVLEGTFGGRFHRRKVPVLVQELERGDLGTRYHAASALATLGPKARSAIPALEKALGDRNQAVRQEAAAALKAIRCWDLPHAQI